MGKTKTIKHQESGRVLVNSAKWCDSFGSKLRGFMFKKTLSHDEGLVLVESRDSRVSTSIHMLFVSFDLGVIWVNSAAIKLEIGPAMAITNSAQGVGASFSISATPPKIKRVICLTGIPCRKAK